MTHLEFNHPKAFHDEDNVAREYVHGVNPTVSGGEFTICGIAFDGDGYVIDASSVTTKKITCPDCITQIKFFKTIKRNEYT